MRTVSATTLCQMTAEEIKSELKLGDFLVTVDRAEIGVATIKNPGKIGRVMPFSSFKRDNKKEFARFLKRGSNIEIVTIIRDGHDQKNSFFFKKPEKKKSKK